MKLVAWVIFFMSFCSNSNIFSNFTNDCVHIALYVYVCYN